MRVKTPWVDALAQKREDARSGQNQTAQSANPDLTPKKMSDSYYSAVSDQTLAVGIWLILIGPATGAG